MVVCLSVFVPGRKTGSDTGTEGNFAAGTDKAFASDDSPGGKTQNSADHTGSAERRRSGKTRATQKARNIHAGPKGPDESSKRREIGSAGGLGQADRTSTRRNQD